ncbi:pentatricopeptide repeat-containing protein [Tanacetum coccineum]
MGLTYGKYYQLHHHSSTTPATTLRFMSSGSSDSSRVMRAAGYGIMNGDGGGGSISSGNLFMWNIILRGFAQSPNPEKAVLMYAQMEKKGFRHDRYTFPFVLKACTKLGWVNVGCGVHVKIMKHGYEDNPFARNTLIYFHANVGDIEIASALKVVDEMPEKDLILWNVMITAYAKRGAMESARVLFDQVPKRDVVTWNAIIAGYVNGGLHKEAFDMFEEMTSFGRTT